MKLSGRFLLALGSAALPLGGCTSVGAPTVTVTGARVLEVTEAGAALEVSLSLTNPNDEPLPVGRVSYRVSLANARGVDYTPFTGDAMPGRTIPARGTQTVTLPASLAAGAGGIDPAALERWRVSGTLVYAPDRGLRAFLTETGVPLPEVAFAGQAGAAK